MKIYTEEDSIKDTGTEYYVSIIESEMQIAEEMPVNGFVRDSGDGEYWLGHFETGTWAEECITCTEEQKDALAYLANFLQIDAQFVSREIVTKGLELAKAVLTYPPAE